MIRSFAFALWLVQGSNGWSVHGMVRRADSNGPIVGALVEVLGTDRRTWSNAGGAYAFTGLTCTPCRVRFSAPTFDSVVIDVDGAAEDTMRVSTVTTSALSFSSSEKARYQSKPAVSDSGREWEQKCRRASGASLDHMYRSVADTDIAVSREARRWIGDGHLRKT